MDTVEKREELLHEWMGLLPKVRQLAEAGDAVSKGMLAQATVNAEQIIERLPMPMQVEHALHAICSIMTWTQMEIQRIGLQPMDPFEFEVLINITAALVIERIRA